MQRRLYDVSLAHVAVFKFSFKEKWHDYRRSFISSALPGYCSEMGVSPEAALERPRARSILENLTKSAASRRPPQIYHSAKWENTEPVDADALIHVPMLFKKNCVAFTPWDFIFRSAMTNHISKIVLFNRRCVDLAQRELAYASTFKAELDVKFSETRTVHVDSYWKQSDFIRGSTLQTCRRYAT